jgi:hypothetical protein
MFHPFPAGRATLGLLAGIALLAALLLPAPLLAADLAVVKAISEDDGAGGWRKVDMSAGTVCMRGGVSTPLRPGFELDEGDRIQTNRSRILIDMGDGVVLLVQENSDLVLGLRQVEQTEGGVFYSVDAPFEITVGQLLVAVEGTRFLVEGADPVLVAVDKGQVRVTSKEEPVLITGGEQVETKQGHVPGGVRSMSMAMRREAWDGTWLMGEPPLSAALLVGGGLIGGAGVSTRVEIGLELPAHLEATLDLGVGIPLSRGGMMTPMGLGVAYELGPVSAGAGLLTAFDSYTNDCGGSVSALHMGGAALVRTGLPLTRRLTLVGALRAGYLGAPLVDLGVGVGMGF